MKKVKNKALADMIDMRQDNREVGNNLNTITDNIQLDEQQYVDTMEKLKDQEFPFKDLPELIRLRVNLLGDRFEAINRHHKEETFKLAYFCGCIINEFEHRVVDLEKRKKSEFTEWRKKAFPRMKVRYLQRWQQVARLGALALEFAYLGLDGVAELEYLFDIDQGKEEGVSEIAKKSINGYFEMIRGSLSDKACIRNAMDAAITCARLMKAGFPEALLNDKEVILLIAKQKKAALEIKEAKALAADISAKPTEEQVTYLQVFARNKSVIPNFGPKTKTENSKSLDALLEKFISRFRETGGAALPINIDTLTSTYSCICEYAQKNGITLNPNVKETK